tara:strand:- start:1893 stop:2153 length:261 start_codon:yes stop_codon:yes gene_type:complete
MDRKSEEIKRRIKLCIAAYAYEVKNDSIMPDSTFDEECKKVDVTITTGNDKMDKWFKDEFDPCTGQWIHSHPEKNRLEELYQKYYR